MKRFIYSVLAFVLLFCSSTWAEVDWQITNTLKFEKAPIDIAVSTRGQRIFVLTEDGVVEVYNSSGELEGKMNVGKHIDSIAAFLDEEKLIISSKSQKIVQGVTIDLLYDINTGNAPFKGNPDAPVVITVFTDYQ